MSPSADPSMKLFLECLAVALDPDPRVIRELTQKYEELGEWLRTDNASRLRSDSLLFPQGSLRHGTVNRPVKGRDDADLDLVYLRYLDPASTGPSELKQAVGEQLRRYIADLRARNRDVPTLKEGRRSWTLDHGREYHLDLLPALPRDLVRTDSGILITDRTLVRWQPSDPKGYAKWFDARKQQAFIALRHDMAKAANVEIEEIPAETVKTPLERVVQMLKRHRDLWYEGPPDRKPISIIITTLAARVYETPMNLHDALFAVLSRASALIERRNGVYWVPNPVDPNENFADRWREDPARAERFFAWLRELDERLRGADRQDGIDKLAERLGPVFGAPAVTMAVRDLGERMRKAREAGRVHVTGTGALTVASANATRVRPHRFYGGKLGR